MRAFIVEAVAIFTAAIDPVFYLFIANMAFAAFLNCRNRHIRAFFGQCLVMAFSAFCRTVFGMGKVRVAQPMAGYGYRRDFPWDLLVVGNSRNFMTFATTAVLLEQNLRIYIGIVIGTVYRTLKLILAGHNISPARKLFARSHFADGRGCVILTQGDH